jgi:hypothetical protein
MDARAGYGPAGYGSSGNPTTAMQLWWHGRPEPLAASQLERRRSGWRQMPQYAHGTMTTEQLDLLTVAGHLDLDGLGQLQQRLDDLPGSGRAVYAMNGIERNPAPHSILGLSSACSAPVPGGQRTNRSAGVCRTRSSRRERGPIVCTGMRGPTVHRRHLGHGRSERRLP